MVSRLKIYLIFILNSSTYTYSIGVYVCISVYTTTYVPYEYLISVPNFGFPFGIWVYNFFYQYVLHFGYLLLQKLLMHFKIDFLVYFANVLCVI